MNNKLTKNIESTVHFIIHLRFIHFIYTFKASINSSIQNKKIYKQQWFSGTEIRRIGASFFLAYSEYYEP